MSVAVRLPSMLTTLLKLPRTVYVSGRTMDEALEDLCRLHPQLAVHLFDESGRLREHVLCFVNDTNAKDRQTPDDLLGDGDTITILQAVSGG